MKLGERLKKMSPKAKAAIVAGIVLVLVFIGYSVWKSNRDKGPGEGFVSGNGRIEATEVDISTKLGGRVEQILVQEGDFVDRGQQLVVMQTDTLRAQLSEAEAQLRQAMAAKAQAEAQVLVRQSDKTTAQATVAQRASDLDAAQRRVSRTSVLSKTGAVSRQEFDDDRARFTGAQAGLAAAKAQVEVADAAIEAAKADVQGAEANIQAAQATINRVRADIEDSYLMAPLSGRIQYRIAQPGEVLAAGGKVLNLVDLNDVYITFFLPNEAAGRVAMGQEVRLVLDTAPDYVIPCKVTYVSSTAQFTPKTVETADERQKLMFRVKANVDPRLLSNHLTQVKTGMPGVAWVKIDPEAQWPENLSRQVVQ